MTRAPQIRRRLVRRIRIKVQNRHTAAVLGKHHRRSLTQATRTCAACDDRRFAFQ
jgi:hypothetical protein